MNLLFLLPLLAVCDGAWTGFRIAQESQWGRKDFDNNILGFVQPVNAAKVTVKQYYGYGKASFVGSGAVASATRPTPKANYVIMFLVWNKYGGSKALMYYTVYDVLNNKRNGAKPGNLYAHYQAYGQKGGIKSQLNDDPGEFRKQGYPKIRTKSDHTIIEYHNAWAVCCTDGHVWGPLTGITKVFTWITRGSKQKTPSKWQFETWGKGARVPLVLTTVGNSVASRRVVRLDNHKCDPKVDCSGRGVCDATTGRCRCQTGYTTANCGKCAPQYFPVVGARPILCTKNMCVNPPPLATGMTIGTGVCKNAKQGQTCTINCQAPQKATGDAKCWGGKWRMPTCHTPKPNDCTTPPQPKPANGDWDGCKDVEHKKFCPIDCNRGFEPNPKGTPGVQCINGNWATTRPSCVPKACIGKPWGRNPVGGTWNAPCSASAGVTNSGQTCNVICQAGYYLTGTSKGATCTNGVWGPAPACHKVCRLPPPKPQPAGTFAGNCAMMKDGGTCTLTCPPNYKKMGDAKCVDGDWQDDDAECLSDLDCHNPPKSPPPGGVGSWSCTNVGTNGKFLVKLNGGCALTCPTGYTSSGPAICYNGQFKDAACVKDAPKFPEMLCRCMSTTQPLRFGHKLCGILPAPDCTTFITHDGFDADEEWGKGNWNYNKPWLMAKGTKGGQWKCGPWDGAYGWKTP